MTTGFDLWDFQVWEVILTFSALLGAMLLANLLRRTIKPLRRTLIPSPVLGGFLLLFVSWLWKLIFGQAMLPATSLEIITFHGLGLGCAAVSLKATEKIKNRHAQRDIFNSALVTVSTYILQAALGLAISFGLYFVLKSWPASGMLIPMGMGQGVGQAYNWGHNYEVLTSTASTFSLANLSLPFGRFENGTSFGLTVAAVGYIAASMGGIFYLTGLRRKGHVKAQASYDEIEVPDDVKLEDVAAPDEVPLSDSMDKLTIQFALVFVSYLLSYGLVALLSWLCDLSGIGLLVDTVKPLLWGFNFIFATLGAIFLRNVLTGFQKKGVIKRKYTNELMLDRVSGFMFDLMVTAAIAAINLEAFKQPTFIIPMLVLCISATVVTYFFVRHLCDRLFPTYNHESFLALYSMLTAATSTGVILLREIDPRFETPACKNLIYQALWACLLGFPLLLFMGFVVRSWLWLLITLLVLSVMFVAFYIWMRFAMKKVAKDKA